MSNTDFAQRRREIVHKIKTGEVTSADGLRQLGFLAKLEACERQDNEKRKKGGKE